MIKSQEERSEKMDKIESLLLLLGSEYYTIDDLRYNQKFGFLFSKKKIFKLKKKKTVVLWN